MKKRVVAKAQKRRRNIERLNRVVGIVQATIRADESAQKALDNLPAEQLRLRAVKRAKEARDKIEEEAKIEQEMSKTME